MTPTAAGSRTSFFQTIELRFGGPQFLGRFAAAFLALILAGFPPCYAGQPEWLSDHPELILSQAQGWGEFGFNTAAHAPGTPGEPLRIGDQEFATGLGHHAPGKLIVVLGGEFVWFEAEVGLQPCGTAGSVIFRAWVDGTLGFDSGILRTGNPARPVRLSVKGAQELVLESADAGDGITCDMANWAAARLTRAEGISEAAVAASVDVAPFAQVIGSDPDRKQGARANRLQEFNAEDLQLETELSPAADGSFRIAVHPNTAACIGLKWFRQRALRELRLKLNTPANEDILKTTQIEAWFGESLWQGEWRSLDTTRSIVDGAMVFQFPIKAPKGGMFQTRKIRCLVPPAHSELIVRELQAYTRTKWRDAIVFIEAEKPSRGAQGEFRVFSGDLLSHTSLERSRARNSGSQATSPPSRWVPWNLSTPQTLTLRYAAPSALAGDETLIQFRLPAGHVGVSLTDLLSHRSVYVPSHGLFVALTDSDPSQTLKENQENRPTLSQYKRRIAGQKTILEQVRQLPDQTLAQAMAKTHHDTQREGPVMLSLACDNLKFVLERFGTLRFPSTTNIQEDWLKNAAQLEPRFGDGTRDRFERRLEGDWLPIPVITVERGGIVYSQRTFVSPCDDPGSDPARLNRPSLCVVEFNLKNTRSEATDARLELQFKPSIPPALSLHWERVPSPHGVIQLGPITARIVGEDSGPLEIRPEGQAVILAGGLPPNGNARCAVFLGQSNEGNLRMADVARLRRAIEGYWRAALAGAAQIETPNEFLNHIIRSSQVRCLIAARNESNGERIAPWIAAMSYGPLESEAHSVIRGMAFLGHDEFARRALDYFIHRYHTNGFLTTGYTTFGTAWHLWTLGECFELNRSTDWLQKRMPELRRTGDWILRQIDKTRPLMDGNQPAPEAGLMPPGVMADWNAFAYHFMMNGYYHAALRELSRMLESVHDSASAALFDERARQLARAIREAYGWTQGQSPALPLRDGTWIPHYPSQVHSPGKLAGFFPGDDAGRSWAYDVELGAHQLAPSRVFDANETEVSRMLDHMEDVQFLGEGWFDYPAAANEQDWFNLGGFAKVQPYYARNAEIYALRNDVKPFIRSYFNSIASLLNPEVLTFWEHFRHSGAWDKTHETGYFLHQTRQMLVQERGSELWLLPLIPGAWLEDGAQLNVSKAPSRFGTLGFRLRSRIAQGCVDVRIDPPTRLTPPFVVLRLRHPGDRKISRFEINSQRHNEWIESPSLVRFPCPDKPANLRIWF
ncbi:MAG TPA: NPCBM/NEW2 domain-containing protein [Candidatus Paceibacterota bacterium]|nr:NPCBM/NEW2 domain-containing protein [Verrucomicrobiota bacterium]HRY51208.1 NPCBM/NEW2 domain-containing protein [Candidatus Paceibacterota bacterium]